MTERLYYENAYLKTFEARVEECAPQDDLWRVRLDCSAFYPTSGGQPFDTGVLGGANVVDVTVENGEVWHVLDRPLTVGDRVVGEIDWPRRFDHMQQHAADHLIAGTIWRRLGGVTIGLHTGEDVSTIDVALPDGATRIDAAEIRAIEQEVNDRIQRDVPVRCWFPSEEDLASLPLRKRPTVSEHVRVVAIGDDEMVACGGTHPSSAGQIGVVKIVSVAPARGKMRVAFLAGRRALADYQRCFDAAHAAAEKFSTTLENLADSVDAMQARLREAELGRNRLQREKLLSQADEMLACAKALPDGVRLIAQFVEADAIALRELCSKLIECERVVALLGAQNGEQAVYVFGRSSDVAADMGKLMREAAKPWGGKGGGKSDFAQGGGKPEILAEAVRQLEATFEK